MAFKINMSGAPPSSFTADHRCRDCGNVWELSLPTEADHEPGCLAFGGDVVGKCCPDCGRYNTERTYMMRGNPVTIVRGNHDFAERQNKRLHERSNDHYRREGKDEAIANQRAVFKREGMESDDKVAKVL